MSTEYALGTSLESYREGHSYYVDFVLTEDCNLRCRYCYLHGKNATHPMPVQVARDAVDFLLNMRPPPRLGVVLNMIGGEALIAMDLIEEITEHFKSRLRQLRHPWQYAYQIMLATNGVLYDDPQVQRFIFENRYHVYPGITLDGTKRKHDLQRVFPDGSGSYDVVARNMKLALKQFPYLGTKVTFSHDDLPFVCESIVHLWEMDIMAIAANVVFEDVWAPGDPELYEAQLRELADVALEKGYWKTHRCNLFWEEDPFGVQEDNTPCGTGKSASFDHEGNIHACIRFMGHSISGSPRTVRPIGNIYTGWDYEAIRAFDCLRKSLVSPKECLECDMQDACGWCAGQCYEMAASDTIYHRAIHICEMHKAQSRANNYYWSELERRYGVKRPIKQKTREHCPI